QDRRGPDRRHGLRPAGGDGVRADGRRQPRATATRGRGHPGGGRLLGGRRPVREPAQAPRRGQGFRRPAPRPRRHPRSQRRRHRRAARVRGRESLAGVLSMAMQVAVLGATGSIGTSTLDVVARHPGRLQASVLAAGSNVEALLALCRRFRPRHAAIADESGYAALRDGLRAAGLDTEAHAGGEAIVQLAAGDACDTVVAAIVGAAGLPSTLAAARAGKRLLLANKESLVLAGELLVRAAREGGALVVPIDSEHNAIFQCLGAGTGDRGPGTGDVARIVLTASGGPFRGWTRDRLRDVTPAQAVKHPKW